MSHDNDLPAKRVQDSLRDAGLSPVLRDLVKQQNLIRDALRTYDLSRAYMDVDQWQRIREGLLTETTFAATEGLSRHAREIRAALTPIQLDPVWDSESMRKILSGIADAQRVAVALPDMTGLRHYRELILSVSKLPRLDMSEVFPDLHVLDDALLRASELRAGITARTEHFTAGLTGLVQGLDHVTTALTSVWEAAELAPERWLAQPRFLRDAPAVGLYEATRSTGILVGVEEPLLEGPDVRDEEDLAEAEIEPRLRNLGPEYVDRYLGALDTARRRGRDWFRQASVSLRELVVDLVRTLAPDEAVFAWNPAAPKDHDGNASYEARVGYLLRNTGPEWARYAKADNEHIRQTILALNKGTHAPSSPFTELAQEITIVRSQYAVLLILTVTQG